jgi:hypothetical protein
VENGLEKRIYLNPYAMHKKNVIKEIGSRGNKMILLSGGKHEQNSKV